MTTATQETALTSDLADTGDLPLGEGAPGDADYEALLRRTGVTEGEAGTTVSAFNSSI
jgi:hypothetical protein